MFYVGQPHDVAESDTAIRLDGLTRGRGEN